MRPSFIDNPQAHLRTQRESGSVDHACAIERPTKSGRHATDWVLPVILVAVAAALYWGAL